MIAVTLYLQQAELEPALIDNKICQFIPEDDTAAVAALGAKWLLSLAAAKGVTATPMPDPSKKRRRRRLTRNAKQLEPVA